MDNCLAIALLIGIGSASRFSLYFGATAEIMPYAETYSRIVAIGMPFLIVTNGMSNSLNQVAITFVQIVLNNSLTYYGAMSAYGKEIPLAACGIVMKTNAILLAVIIGISQGSQPIIGFNYGARQYDRVRKTYKLAVTANLAVSAAGFILFQFFPYQIIALFGTGEPAYFEFAIHFMRVFLFMVIVNGVQLISSNFFAAIGKPLKGLLLSMTRQVFFLIPLVLILPLFMGLDGILYAGPAADSIAFIITVTLIARELGKMKHLETQQTGLSQPVLFICPVNDPQCQSEQRGADPPKPVF